MLELLILGALRVFYPFSPQKEKMIYDDDVLKNPLPSPKDDIFQVRSDWARLNRDYKKSFHELAN
jgi:hypothetical protein